MHDFSEIYTDRFVFDNSVSRLRHYFTHLGQLTTQFGLAINTYEKSMKSKFFSDTPWTRLYNVTFDFYTAYSSVPHVKDAFRTILQWGVNDLKRECSSQENLGFADRISVIVSHLKPGEAFALGQDEVLDKWAIAVLQDFAAIAFERLKSISLLRVIAECRWPNDDLRHNRFVSSVCEFGYDREALI